MELQNIILIHYHEIGLKGKNRSFFEGQLQKNVKQLILRADIHVVKIQRISGRIVIFFDHCCNIKTVSQCFDLIRSIPGVARVSRGLRCDQSLEGMIFAGTKIMSDSGASVGPENRLESFKVSARRNHTNFATNSMEINQIVGGAISDAFPDVRVQMKNPALTVSIEVIEGACYVYGTSVPGVGGLPVGCSGRVVGLLSSGIDSPVALWKMARRGANVIGVHFSGAPIVANESEYLVDEIGEVLRNSGCIKRIYNVRIGEYQREIARNSPEKIRIILYRRLFYKVAEQIARKEHAKALVTGESLGQVASQTLDNLSVTDASVDMPVLRPLIGSDKIEIVDRAQKIGTLKISEHQAPDCCTLYMPKTPETHAKLPIVEEAESKLPYDRWIPEILSSATVKDYK